MRNTADVTGGKPIADLLQSISDVSAINPLVTFYIHVGKREVLFFLSRTPHEGRHVKLLGAAALAVLSTHSSLLEG
jgi:hypothetical protein